MTWFSRAGIFYIDRHLFMLMVVTGISKKIKKSTHCDKIDGRGQLIRREWIDNKRLDENTMRIRGALAVGR